jgi:hypothetical protein
MSKSHLTALRRNKLSQPAQWLFDKGLIKGRALDYGSGQGYDARALDLEAYDPHFSPIEFRGKYTTIMCNFVLNVIEDEDERAFVLLRIASLLAIGGVSVAYITVRADKRKLNGATKRGTWQGYIELDLPVVKKTANWVMYRLTRNESLA